MDKLKEKKEKTPAIDSFPTDETPTPTKEWVQQQQHQNIFINYKTAQFIFCRFKIIVEPASQILRMADLDLFQDLKENPFDLHFRKATEAVKAGQDGLSSSLSTTEIPGEESLNTPQIFCSDGAGPGGSSPALTSRPVILRSHSHNRAVQQTSNIPIASVQPVKAFKAIAPSPSDNALLLLRLPGGETVKLSNLPFVKYDSGQPPPPPAGGSAGGSGSGGGGGITVNKETKLKLKKTLKTSRSTTAAPASVSAATPESAPARTVETDSGISDSPPGGGSALEERDDLKERNRMSARRSRLKKRQQLEEMQADKCVLSAENKALRAEVSRLKEILSSHLDCSVSLRAGTRQTFSRQVCPSPEDQEVAQPETQTETVAQTEAQPVNKQKNIETQTAAHCEPYQNQSQSQSTFRYESATSPPQTYPEDLRVRVDTKMDTKMDGNMDSKVDSRLKEEEKSVPAENSAVTPRPPVMSPGPGTEGRRSKIKQRLALHCAKVGQKKKLKATNKARLKDKLQIIKQKMAEDENVWSSLQTTKNK